MSNKSIDDLFEDNCSFFKTIEGKINKNNYIPKMSSVYIYMKNLADNYYDSNSELKYNYLLHKMLYLEEKFHYSKIIDFDLPILYKDDKKPVDNYLDSLVFSSRRAFLKFHDRKIIDTNYVDFRNKCIVASQEVFKKCTHDGIKAYIVKIYPGYDRKNEIENELCCHYFNLVYYNEKYYLVDLSYAQFFNFEKNNFDRLGVLNSDGCNVGIYMMQNDIDKKIVKEILTKGYIELNEDIFKRYMDAFTLSFRNGLFYESNNIKKFETNYLVEDYINFIEGYDNQINYEGLENLGNQTMPLKSNEIDFKSFVK